MRQYAKQRIDRELGLLESQIAEIEALPKEKLLNRMGDLHMLYRSHKVKLDAGFSVLVLGFGCTLATSMMAGLIGFGWTRARGYPVTETALQQELTHTREVTDTLHTQIHTQLDTQLGKVEAQIAAQSQTLIDHARAMELQQEKYISEQQVQTKQVFTAACCSAALAAVSLIVTFQTRNGNC